MRKMIYLVDIIFFFISVAALSALIFLSIFPEYDKDKFFIGLVDGVMLGFSVGTILGFSKGVLECEFLRKYLKK